jgi:hypothetical protein
VGLEHFQGKKVIALHPHDCQAIEKYCKTPTAYSGLEDVTKEQVVWNNSMQSFFFAGMLQ